MDCQSKLNIKEIDNGVSFNIKLTPNSSKNEIIGVENRVLKVKTTVIPEKGKANIEMIKGQTDKNKTVFIKDIKVSELLSKLS